jgi:hypothetical protein
VDDNVWRARSLSFTESVESVMGSEGIENLAAVRKVGLDIEDVWVSIMV